MDAGDDYRGRYERTLRLASALAELSPLAAVAVNGSIAAIDEALRALIGRAADVLEVGMCGVWRYDHVTHELRAHLNYERAIRAWSANQVVTAESAPNYLRALQVAEAVPANDARTDPRTNDLADSYLIPLDVGALLDAAMKVRGIFAGVVCFEHLGSTRRWAPEEIRFAIGIAALAGALLERHDYARVSERADPSGLQFDELYDDVPFGVVTFSVDGAIRRINPAILAMFGAGGGKATYLGRPLAELLGAAAPDLVELRAKLVSGPVHARIVHRGGTADLTFVAMRTPTGIPGFIAGVAIGRTIEVGALAALSAIREAPATAELVDLLRTLARLLGADCALIGRMEPRPGWVRADPLLVDGELRPAMTYELVGTPCENVLRGTVCTVASGARAAFPADKMLAELMLDSYAGTALRGRHGEVVGLIAVLARAPIAPGLPVVEIVGAFAKLVETALQRETAERETEDHKQFLQHIAGNINEVFWIASWPERVVQYVTPSIEAISGRTVAEVMAPGRQLRDLVHPSDIGELAKQVATGAERFELEHRLLRPDGSVRYVKTNAFFLRDASGRPIRLAGITQDLTLQREADDRVREVEERMAEMLARSHQEVVQLQTRLGEGHRLGGLLGASPMMRDVFRRLRQAADADVTVLIIGESGTGKELAAAAVHELGARRGKPFVALNCAAIPESLLESELFGYVKGAFTGAARDRVGLMQAAHGGTLFLDEIGDMPAQLQVKLLRALQQREIRRLGDDKPIAVDFRLISATHRDLKAAVASGHLREDFYYRIRVFEIEMPPLRARAEDIPLLASHFASELGRLANKSNVMIAQDAMRRLLDYDWPGNVRELRNAIERAIVSAERGAIQVLDLPTEIRGDTGDSAIAIDVVDARVEIEDALEKTGGNRTEAARLLGISRVTLWKRMRRLGLVTSPVDDEA